MSIILTYLLLFIGSVLGSPPHQLSKKGVPLLQNFTPADYSHKGKIWDIDTAPDGIVYMASDKGLLEYDGEKWKSYKGSDGITRAVTVINDSLIYTGSDLDFGVWKRKADRNFTYTSLYPFKEDLNGISEEFWDVYSIDGKVLFVSANNVYVYTGSNLTKIPSPSKIKSSFNVKDTLYFVDEKGGVYEFKNLSPKHLFSFKNSNIPEVVGMYENQGRLIFVTKNAGLWQYAAGKLSPLNNELSAELKEAKAFSFERVDKTYLAFGTILRGLFISDLNGDIIHYINKNKGLENNTILSLHYSPDGKLWMGLDYGVSYVDLSSKYTFFYDYAGDFGTGYSATLRGNTFYLGTNQGLYQTRWTDLNDKTAYYKFNLIPGTEGQVWTLKKIGNQVLVGHDRGLFILKNTEVQRLGNQRGIWTIQPYEKYLLVGTYNGISIYEKNGESWKYLKNMKLIVGSCNQILIQGDHTLWVNIPNYGFIRAELNQNLFPEKRKIFLVNRFKGSDPNLQKSKDGIHIVTSNYDYSYDSVTNKFVENRRDTVKTGIDKLFLPDVQSVRLSDNFEFYPVYNGFALKELNMTDSLWKGTHKIVFRSIQAFNNEKKVNVSNGTEIPSKLNNLKVESIVPNQDGVLYQYRIDPSGTWSKWSPQNTFELIALPAGSHVLAARAMVNGGVTPIQTISFFIDAPWYRSWYAYLMYFVLFLLMIYLLYVWQDMSLNKQKKNMLIAQRDSLRQQEERHRQQLQHIEEEKLQAEIEQLKAQFKSKTIELATKAKENDEKNKILLTIKEKFEKLEQNPTSLKHRLHEIRQVINSHISSEDHTFEIQIDDLNQEFFDKLRQDYPDLTSYDLRLCAYIKTGFNSKEIADLLNIKPSSVYISRSRLRKKLNIETDEDLHGYLNSV